MIATTRMMAAIFSFGFALGISLAYIFFKTEEIKYRMQIKSKMLDARFQNRKVHGMEYESMAEVNEFMLGYSKGKFHTKEDPDSKILTTTSTTTPQPDYSTTEIVGSVSDHSKDEDLHVGEEFHAIELSNSVRILCFVLTSPSTHKQKAVHVKRTWGKRCNILLFITTQADAELEPVVIVENIHEDRSYLWAKTKHAIRHIYQHYMDEADWFLKADDDTYIVMENLRYMLRNYDANETHYFGHTFAPSWLLFDYMSGGAGYVMSKRTVARLVEEAFPSNNTSQCRQDHIDGTELSEDLEIGRCINLLKINSSDSRDVLGRLRFFPFSPEVHIFHSTLNNSEFDWWWKYTKYSHEDGLECCSDTAVAFHYVSPQNMYLYEYFLYHLRPFGINRRLELQELIETSTEDYIYSDPELGEHISQSEVEGEELPESVTASISIKLPPSPAPNILNSSIVPNTKAPTVTKSPSKSNNKTQNHFNLIVASPTKNVSTNSSKASTSKPLAVQSSTTADSKHAKKGTSLSAIKSSTKVNYTLKPVVKSKLEVSSSKTVEKKPKSKAPKPKPIPLLKNSATVQSVFNTSRAF